ncbi:MAG: hypothetical protein B6I18_03550 [Bacteroidetes bacterium 4572_112]|nr:MAG: hypothetical protein B6I18_03550 [Bacteroidetes bacterium 4572_112]
MRISLLLLSFLIIVNGFSQSASSDSIESCKVNGKYFKEIATDFPKLIISPIKWSGGEWIAAGAVLGAGALLYTQDKVIAEWWQSNRTDALDDANTYFFDPYGKMYYTAPLMGGLYLYGVYADDNKSKRVAMDFVQATIYSSVVVTVIKHLAHRQRPYQTDPLNPYLWDGLSTDDWGHTSFPSGHSITAFTFAAVVGTHYKETVWVPVVAYSLAVLEGASRMYANKHWSSDVLIGSALGYAIGTFVVNQNHCKLKAMPIISTNFTGIGFSYGL